MINWKKVIKGLECCHIQRNEVPPLCEDCPYKNPMEGTCDALDELLGDALTLLKAQEPVKPTLEEHWETPSTFDEDIKIVDYLCRNCGRIINKEDDYCPRCGRAIKWK